MLYCLTRWAWYSGGKGPFLPIQGGGLLVDMHTVSVDDVDTDRVYTEAFSQSILCPESIACSAKADVVLSPL